MQRKRNRGCRLLGWRHSKNRAVVNIALIGWLQNFSYPASIMHLRIHGQLASFLDSAYAASRLLAIVFLCLGVLSASRAFADRITPQPLSGSAKAGTKAVAGLTVPCNQDADRFGPAMAVLRPASYLMGSPADEEGRLGNEAQHTATIPRPFAISRCEITVGQFRQFVRDTGYKTTAETDGKGCISLDSGAINWVQEKGRYWGDPGFAQGDDHPVVCVSWDDAQRYAAWLSVRSGALYRLPTEAEWEYAARGGTQTARYFGAQSQCEFANGLDLTAKDIAASDWKWAECRDGFVYTAPAGSFKPNAFGLFDMLGNVSEWTLDCWRDGYKKNAPRDGSAWLAADGGDCVRRVVRGESWFNNPRYLRSAFRNWSGTDDAYYNLGFRVARAL